jgi:hypothetical protein
MSEEETKAYREDKLAYDAFCTKYSLADYPTVVFLAPDGSELSKLVQPRDEAQLVEAVKAVPPLLAKWIAGQRQRQEAPPPPPAGVRPDVPERR